MGCAHISTLRSPSLAPTKERVEDRVPTGQDRIKVEVVSGANGQTTDVTATPEGALYASILKQSRRTCARGAVTMKEEVTD